MIAPEKKQLRLFGLLLSLAIGLWLSVGLYYFGLSVPIATSGYGLASVLLLLSCFRPESLAPVYRRWSKAALLLNRTLIATLLGLIYYLVITPVGVIKRRLGNDPVRQSASSHPSTYLLPSEPIEPTDMEAPF